MTISEYHFDWVSFSNLRFQFNPLRLFAYLAVKIRKATSLNLPLFEHKILFRV